MSEVMRRSAILEERPLMPSIASRAGILSSSNLWMNSSTAPANSGSTFCGSAVRCMASIASSTPSCPDSCSMIFSPTSATTPAVMPASRNCLWVPTIPSMASPAGILSSSNLWMTRSSCAGNSPAPPAGIAGACPRMVAGAVIAGAGLGSLRGSYPTPKFRNADVQSFS